MSVASWALTPGPYVLGWVFASTNATLTAANITLYGFMSLAAIASGLGGAMSNLAFPGLSASSVAALPTSIGITNTSGYVRTGASVFNQPWMLLQGT